MTATRVTLMSQHYGISKSDLIAVLDLAASALDGRHAAPGQIHDGCPSCDAAFALVGIRNSVESDVSACVESAGRAEILLAGCPFRHRRLAS